MARPKNTDGEKRSVRIAFMVSESEEQEIRTLAKAHGFDQHGAFIRSASLGKIPVDRGKVMMAAFPLATNKAIRRRNANGFHLSNHRFVIRSPFVQKVFLLS